MLLCNSESTLNFRYNEWSHAQVLMKKKFSLYCGHETIGLLYKSVGRRSKNDLHNAYSCFSIFYRSNEKSQIVTSEIFEKNGISHHPTIKRTSFQTGNFEHQGVLFMQSSLQSCQKFDLDYVAKVFLLLKYFQIISAITASSENFKLTHKNISLTATPKSNSKFRKCHSQTSNKELSIKCIKGK